VADRPVDGKLLLDPGKKGVCSSYTLTLSRLRYWATVISWSATAVGFVFSVSLGILFGIYPALRAAGLEPVEALRAE